LVERCLARGRVEGGGGGVGGSRSVRRVTRRRWNDFVSEHLFPLSGRLLRARSRVRRKCGRRACVRACVRRNSDGEQTRGIWVEAVVTELDLDSKTCLLTVSLLSLICVSCEALKIVSCTRSSSSLCLGRTPRLLF
jgi:hypothetical protein